MLQKINLILEKVVVDLIEKYKKEKEDEEFFKKILEEERKV